MHWRTEVDPSGLRRVAVDLGTVIDRTQFGLAWQARLFNGKPALGNDVKLIAKLELVERSDGA